MHTACRIIVVNIHDNCLCLESASDFAVNSEMGPLTVDEGPYNRMKINSVTAVKILAAEKVSFKFSVIY